MTSFQIVVGTMDPTSIGNNADTCRFLFHGLQDAGYKAAISVNTLHPGRINLFLDRVENDVMLRALETGKLPYAVVCTETISPAGVFGVGGESRPDTMAKLIRLMRGASFILCLLEESITLCRAINPRSVYLPFGYVKAFETIRALPFEQREFDVVMTGHLTPRRTAVLRV
jgi:hypothetical protein